MGNTNIPQFGAVDSVNSRDTRDGADQLTEDQLKQRDGQVEGGVNALLPDSVANESQRAVIHADHGKNVIGKPARDTGHEANSDVEPTAADRAALAGHVGSGHSPSDAT